MSASPRTRTTPTPLHRPPPRPLATRVRDAATVVAAMALVVAGANAYTVRQGDTLTGIAAEHDTTVQALVDANGIDNPNLIIAGQSLRLPGGASSTTTPAASTASGTSPAGTRASAGRTVPSLGPTGDPADQRVHVVRPGETVDSIAADNGIQATQFMAANGLTSRGQLLSGSRVQMSANGPAPGTGSTGDATHRVRAGDTLIGIAARAGTSPRAIADANALSNANFIVIGQVLTLPGAGSGYTCPVPGATFINDWGVAKPDGRFHQGVDLLAPVGTPILAPAAGHVTQVEGARGGLQFRLDADDGYVHFGSHLDSFGTRGRVAAGAVLGTVGTSGNAVGGPAHLHYSVLYEGGLVNPYPSLRATC